MSAIAGLIHKTGEPVEASDLERMGNALRAHGGSGGAWRKSAVGLVQRRSLFTPEDRYERQPLISSEPPGGLVCASRLANRLDLAQTLGLDASQARSAPDSLLLWHAYLRWAEDCPRHLTGDYTFAVWDEQKSRLFLAASPFSTQPLHYFQSSPLFAFASMPKGLFALEEVPRRLDEEYVSKYLARVPRAPGTTFYREIYRLLPGQTLTVERGCPAVIRTYDEWETDSELRFSSDAAYEEAFLNLYTEVVQDHLHAAAPVGIMLSGGLDSASLAAVAAPLLDARHQRLAAYTEAPRAGFVLPSSSPRYADEGERVQAIARFYPNLDVSLLRPDGTHFLRDIKTYFDHVELPFRNACNRPWIEAILGQAQAQGVGVLLMGSMGNSTVSWRGRDADQKIGAGWKGLRHRVLTVLPPPLRRAASQVRDRAARIAAPPRPTLLRPEAARRYGIEARQGSSTSRSGAAERYEQLQRTTAQSAALWTGYQAMFGVEVRDPTGDERIVRFCLALPPEQFCREGVSRRLLRRTMAGRLPAEIVSGERRGLQSADWLLTLRDAQDELRAELDPIERCEAAKHLIDLPRLRRSLEELTYADNALDIGLRNTLEQGLMTGRFLSWFETGE